MEFIVPFLTVSARGQSEETSKWSPWFTDWRNSEKRSGEFAFIQNASGDCFSVLHNSGTIGNVQNNERKETPLETSL